MSIVAFRRRTMPEPQLYLHLLASYLLGGVPFGWLSVRLLRGIDLRTVGSGNIGATNAGRVLGRWGAISIFFLDMGKGFVAAFLLGSSIFGSPWNELAPLLCGFAAILGHCFTPYLRFRGGKGVATTVGVLLALDPWSFLAAGLGWIVAMAIWRMVSLASLVLGLVFPIAIFVRHGAQVLEAKLPLFATAILVFVLIAVRHRTNIQRILNGTEPRAFQKKKAQEVAP